MRHIAILSIVLFCASLFPLAAQTVKPIEIVPAKNYEALRYESSPALQSMLNQVVGEVLNAYPNKAFKMDELAVSLLDMRDLKNIRSASVNGEKQIYPASVVKVYYMVALHRQLEDGKIKLTPELERGLRDMIVDSSNEATQYILDVLTDTSSGGEMPEKEFNEWSYKRNRVNRYFSAMEYERINVNQKTFCEDAYGREQQFRNYRGENRNMLNTNATARLMAEIALGRMNTPKRTQMMMDLMERKLFKADGPAVSPAPSPAAPALIKANLKGAKLWSKPGGTSKSLHDAIYVETPDGLKFALVIFTENHAKDEETLPSIVSKLIDGMRKIKE